MEKSANIKELMVAYHVNLVTYVIQYWWQKNIPTVLASYYYRCNYQKYIIHEARRATGKYLSLLHLKHQICL